jgi:hypothetical protein
MLARVLKRPEYKQAVAAQAALAGRRKRAA